LVLTMLTEWGLLGADWKHKRDISRKEQSEGRKLTFQKYFLSPSARSIYLFIGIVFLIGISASLYPTKNDSEITQVELLEISRVLEKWKSKYGVYPNSLKEITKGRPLRKTLLRDSWNRNYKYDILENGTKFILISLGSDGELGTEDDVIFKYKI